MSTTFCPNCGAPIQPGTDYCMSCGKRVNETNPNPIPNPIPNYSTPPQKNNNSTQLLIIVLLMVIIGLLIGVCVYFALRSSSSSNEQEASAARVDTVVKKDTVVLQQPVPAKHRVYTRPSNPTQVVVTGRNVRLRAEPYIDPWNENSNTLTNSRGYNVHPYKGQALPYLGEEGDFYKVNYNGYICYISKRFSYLR